MKAPKFHPQNLESRTSRNLKVQTPDIPSPPSTPTFMSGSFSRSNSLLPRFGGTGSPEFTIEFEVGPASQQYRIRPSESTIRWYNDLISRKVQYLQLCKEGAHYFAVLSLEDGSIFQLKFGRSKNPQNSRNICSLFRLSQDSILLSMCLFSIEGVGDIAHPVSDIKFIIATCLPLCQKLDPTQASHGTLFALTLATVVARKCVDVKTDHLVGTGTPLDNFWGEIISSTKPVNQPLWEESMVDSIRHEVRNWIFLKAREHVAACLFRHDPPPILRRDARGASVLPAVPVNNSPSTASSEAMVTQGMTETVIQNACFPKQAPVYSSARDGRERTSAASVVAWLEFAGPNQAAKSLALWDATWSSTWEKEWGKSWLELWTKQQGENITKVVKPSQFTDHVPLVSGRASGKIAGKIPIDTAIMFEFMVKMPSHSLLQWEFENAAQWANCQEDREVALVQDKEVVWFQSWRCLRYPNPPDSWCPSWELAVVMAWVLRWEMAVEMGQKSQAAQIHTQREFDATRRQIVAGPATVTESPRGSREQLSHTASPPVGSANITTTAPHRQTQAEPRLPLPTGRTKYSRNKLLIVTRLLGQMRTRYLKRLFEQPGITNQVDFSSEWRRNPACVLGRVVDFAWDLALKSPGSPESNLSHTATSVFHLAKKNFGSQVPNRMAALSVDKWEQVFKEAWEKTWKRCWREAWSTVMKETEKVVLKRGIQEGFSCARDEEDRRFTQREVSHLSGEPMPKLEPTVILSRQALASLETIEREMLQNKLSVDYRRCIPSIFVSMEQLYQEMTHSSPVVHPGMVIKMFDERPLLQAIVYAKSKTKALWDQKAEEESFKIVSHTEFQSRVKSLANDIPGIQSPVLEQSIIEWMGDMWREVIATSISIDQDFTPEISEPEHAFRTIPHRATTYYPFQRADAPNPGEETQEAGANQSIFGRIFKHGKAGP